MRAWATTRAAVAARRVAMSSTAVPRRMGPSSVVLVVELPGLVVARRRAVSRLPARGGVVVVLDLHHDRLGRGKRRQIDRRARALRDDAGLPIRSFAQAERHPRWPPAAAGQVVAAAIRELRARPLPTRAPAAVLPRGGASACDRVAGAVEDAQLVARRGERVAEVGLRGGGPVHPLPEHPVAAVRRGVAQRQLGHLGADWLAAALDGAGG